MKDYIGKQLEMVIDGKKLRFELLDVKQYELIARSENKIVHIPLNKIGMYSVVDEDASKVKASRPEVNIYMCKNDVSGCRGTKLLSLKDDAVIKDIPCKLNNNEDCEFAKVGNLYDLPDKIQMAFLNGMMTSVPIIKEETKKTGAKNGKRVGRTNRKNK